MMLRKIAVLAMAMSIALLGVSGCAMPIHYEEGSLKAEAIVVNDVAEVVDGAAEEEIPETAEAVEIPDGDAESEEAEPENAGPEQNVEEGPIEVDVADFHILSRIADGDILVFADGQYLKIDESAMADVIAQVGSSRIDGLPGAEDFTPLAQSDRSDDVKAMQEMLKAMGYLSGNADGQYGGQSVRAVSDFERDMGLAQTGEASQLLQLLMASVCEAPVEIVSDFEPADRYAAIAGKTTADLNAIAQSGLELEYDDISGTGEIGDGTVIVLDATDGADIDSYAFQLCFVLLVEQMEDGEVVVEPGVRVRCECIRRPIMQKILLKSGDARCTVPIGEVDSALSGAKSVETAVAPLDADAVRLLANAEKEGELKFRIVGRYQSFDGEVAEEQLAAVSNVGQAGLSLE